MDIAKKPPQADYGSTKPHDEQIWERIEAVIKEADHSFTDVLNCFPVYIRRVNLSRFLAHYELFRMIQDVPGHIVECGVFRGASLMSFAKFLEIFCAGDRARKVYGFDNFEGFASLHEKDGSTDSAADKVVGGWNAGHYFEELQKHVEIFHADSFVPHSQRVILVKGDISTGAAEFMQKNPGFRISLLHLDVDMYEPTLAALKAFYPAVVPGGLVVIDEYAITTWPGESAAVEEYFGEHMPRMKKFPFQSLPGAFFVKQ